MVDHSLSPYRWGHVGADNFPSFLVTWYLATIPGGDSVGYEVSGGIVTDASERLRGWVGKTRREIEAKARREGWKVNKIKAD